MSDTLTNTGSIFVHCRNESVKSAQYGLSLDCRLAENGSVSQCDSRRATFLEPASWDRGKVNVKSRVFASPLPFSGHQRSECSRSLASFLNESCGFVDSKVELKKHRSGRVFCCSIYNWNSWHLRCPGIHELLAKVPKTAMKIPSLCTKRCYWLSKFWKQF